MTIPIKINCGCGQNYAFDVEPVAGRLPSTVACPSCGIDGTATANEMLAQRGPAQPTAVIVPPLGVSPLRMAAPPPPQSAMPAPTENAEPIQPLDHTRAINDARAKIMWGDTRQQAIACLMSHNIPPQAANSIVTGLMREGSSLFSVE